jgi:hypothetical protein
MRRPTLLALGHDAQRGRTIRLSLGRFTTEQDIDQAVQLIKAALRQCTGILGRLRHHGQYEWLAGDMMSTQSSTMDRCPSAWRKPVN